MPTETMSALEAIRISSKNEARTWFGSARERFEQTGSYFDIRHKPKWLLDQDDVIFTMGSCFARNVENVLSSCGMNLALQGHGVALEHYDNFDDAPVVSASSRSPISRGAFNKYTVASMAHDLRRVINDEKYPDEGLIELGPDRWFDPHASGLKHLPLDIALANRESIARAVATVRKSSAVFMTLGLTEGWIDKKTGLAINRHPGVPVLRRHADRFQFISYSYDDVLADIREIISLLRSVRSDMKMAMTVSPVPFGATWRDVDVVVANTYSKSTLRAALEAVTRNDPLVDYFPSYEIVVNSPRKLAWKDDQIHVDNEMVAHVMKIFQRSYLDKPV